MRSSIRRCERFRFDYYLLSCTADVIGKRCEALMRAAEKELIELDKKSAASTAALSAHSSILGGDLVGSRTDRMTQLIKQITDEARKLANTRTELQKLKAVPSTGAGSGGATQTILKLTAADSGVGHGQGAKKAAAGEGKGAKSKAEDDEERLVLHRFNDRIVPEELIPELLRLVQAAGPNAQPSIVLPFISKYPQVSRRQVEMKISEMAVKEKRECDPTKLWRVKDEYEYYLKIGLSDSKDSKPKKQTVSVATSGDGFDNDADDSGKKKRKGSLGASGASESSAVTPTVKSPREAK